MRVDLVVRDVLQSLQAVIRGLDNRLTAGENLAPEGTSGQVLTSNGDRIPPSYQPPSVEQRTDDPASPVLGQIWYRTDTNELKIKSLAGIKRISMS